MFSMELEGAESVGVGERYVVSGGEGGGDSEGVIDCMISGSLSVLSSFASKSSHSFLSPLLSHCGDKIYIKQIQLIIFFILPPQPSEISS